MVVLHPWDFRPWTGGEDAMHNKGDLDRFATKVDISSIREDMKCFATKTDLIEFKDELHQEMRGLKSQMGP